MGSIDIDIYAEFKKEREKEIDSFPMFYAYDEKQIREGMRKIKCKSRSELSGVPGFFGLFMRTVDIPRFFKMVGNRMAETQSRIATDPNFAKAAFLYEMNNCEYAINVDGYEEILSELCINRKFVNDHNLKPLIKEAGEAHYAQMREKGII